MKIVNECRINFKFKLYDGGVIVSKTIFSNAVSTTVINENLIVEKYSNKKETYSLDIIKYTICVCNKGKNILKSVFFQDILEKGIRFIENSLKIDGIKKFCKNPEEGFLLGDLAKDKKVKITFEVLVLPQKCKKLIKNYSSIYYGYIYNVEKPPIVLKKESNRVITKYENRVFTQVTIVNILKVKLPIDEILKVNTKVKILESKIIGEYDLNIQNLLIIGRVEYKVLYKSKNSCKCIEDVFGFSTSIKVPLGIKYFDKKNVKGIIEYMTSYLIDKNKICINGNILLFY